MNSPVKAALAGIAGISLCGCVFTPQTVTRYDPKCDIEYRKLVLNAQPLELGNSGLSCSDNCGPLLAAFALVPATSAVVSGSIVLIGNTVYWIERRGQCIGS